MQTFLTESHSGFTICVALNVILLHASNMSEPAGYFPTPVHTAGLVCRICGDLDLPLEANRLRSWHSREGLTLGTQDGGWRRYSDFDLLAIVLIRLLSDHGVLAGQSCPAFSDTKFENDLRWAVRRAVNSEEEDESNEVFIALMQRTDKPLFLVSGYRAPVLETAAKASSVIATTPVMILNLSSLAQRVRNACLASPQYLKREASNG